MRQEQPSLPEMRLYSAVFEETQGADEREYFEAVAACCVGVPASRIVCDRYWALREFGTDGGYPLDEPELHMLRSQTLAVVRPPARDGCRVTIWGEGGDQALGMIVYYRPATLRGAGWRHALAELPYYRQGCQYSAVEVLLRAYVWPLVPDRVAGWLRRLRANRTRTRPWLGEDRPTDGWSTCLLDAGYAKPRHLAPAAEFIHQYVRSSHNVTRYSALDVTMAHAGVEWRLPFLDRRLAEFMLHVPHHLVAWRGTRRVILREAMQGTLPEAVRIRMDKRHVEGLNRRGLSKEQYRVNALLAGSRAEALGFLDADALGEAIEEYLQDHTGSASHLEGALGLEAWLRATAH
jgi:asparagine synthase (glutamine-hydrolysing)